LYRRRQMVSHCKNAAGGQSEWKLDKVGRAGELGTAAAKGAVSRQKRASTAEPPSPLR
jgi:hypothetical protein